MTNVTVENKSNQIDFKKGDLVEYPDGMVLMVTSIRDEGLLGGVVLKEATDPAHVDGDYIGTHKNCWCKNKVNYSCKRPKKFNSKMILEQYDDGE